MTNGQLYAIGIGACVFLFALFFGIAFGLARHSTQGADDDQS